MSDLEYVIAPPGRLISIDWRELKRYRDLFFVLARRDIAVRYKQTILGIFWAVLQPFVTMVVFTFIFHVIGNVPTQFDAPYPVFLYVGLLFWRYYSETLTGSANSMISNAGLIQKIYFPRLIVPATAATTGLVDFGIGTVILTGMMIYYGYCPSLIGLLIFPLLLACAVICALGMGLFAASLNVKYRDVRHALPFFISTLMFVTPVVYSAQALDKHPIVKVVMLWLNPISGVISSARTALLSHQSVDWRILGVSTLMSALFFVFGLYYFRSAERYFADIV
ncbi:MAG: ABC transporter permease [Armatimonadota bacterium]|nr:ABC transporter permease [Armatimonadota bacterium]